MSDTPPFLVRLIGKGVGYTFSLGGGAYSLSQVVSLWSKYPSRSSTLTEAGSLAGSLTGFLWGTIITGIGAAIVVAYALLEKGYALEGALRFRDPLPTEQGKRSLLDITPLRKLD